MKAFKLILVSIIAVLTLSACGSSAEDQHGFSSITFPTYKKMTIGEFTDLFDDKAFEFYEEENRVMFEGSSSNLLYKDEVIGLTVYLRQGFDSEGTPSKFHIELVTNKKPDHNGTIGGRIEYISNNNLTEFYATKFNTSGSTEDQSSNNEADRQFHNLIETILKILKSKGQAPEKVTEAPTKKTVINGLSKISFRECYNSTHLAKWDDVDKGKQDMKTIDSDTEEDCLNNPNVDQPDGELAIAMNELKKYKAENDINKSDPSLAEVATYLKKELSVQLIREGASKRVIDFCWSKFAPDSAMVIECAIFNMSRGTM